MAQSSTIHPSGVYLVMIMPAKYSVGLAVAALRHHNLASPASLGSIPEFRP